MMLSEANVIGSAVRLDEIPPQYREMTLLGRGATTLAFERDSHTVLIFTRDQIKLEWLRDGLRLVHHYHPVNPVRSHHIMGMRDLPIYMVVMPKLYPLDSHNKKLVSREMRQFVEVSQKAGLGPNKNWEQRLALVIDEYHDRYPHSKVLPLLEWLANYEPGQFYLDLGARQFKQTSSGDLVLLDPVVSSDLLDLLLKKR
jgi:hypothetical protein